MPHQPHRGPGKMAPCAGLQPRLRRRRRRRHRRRPFLAVRSTLPCPAPATSPAPTWVRSCSAWYCATTALSTSFPIEGSTRSSQSVPRFCTAQRTAGTAAGVSGVAPRLNTAAGAVGSLVQGSKAGRGRDDWGSPQQLALPLMACLNEDAGQPNPCCARCALGRPAGPMLCAPGRCVEAAPHLAWTAHAA